MWFACNHYKLTMVLVRLQRRERGQSQQGICILFQRLESILCRDVWRTWWEWYSFFGWLVIVKALIEAYCQNGKKGGVSDCQIVKPLSSSHLTMNKICSSSGSRTRTDISAHWILSPERIPISPLSLLLLVILWYSDSYNMHWQFVRRKFIHFSICRFDHVFHTLCHHSVH